MKCPNCKEGFIPAFSKIMPLINCDICGGTGELPEGVEYNPIKGALLKSEKMVTDMSLRQYCLKYGIDAAERSKNERGFFKKEERKNEL